jgi:hypothetical protein
MRGIQTGRVQQYLLVMMIAALIIGLLFALSAGLLSAAP